MAKWWTRNFVHRRWSNLYYLGLLAVFLGVQYTGPGLGTAAGLTALLFVVVAPHRWNVGDKIEDWERRRYPL